MKNRKKNLQKDYKIVSLKLFFRLKFFLFCNPKNRNPDKPNYILILFKSKEFQANEYNICNNNFILFLCVVQSDFVMSIVMWFILSV